MRPDGDLTGALQRWDDGDAGALDDLLQAAHAHVRAALAAVLRRGSAPQSLQPSAIVQAAFPRLVDARRLSWQQRARFLGLLARVTRHVLVAHARRRAEFRQAAAARPLHVDSGAVPPASGLEVDLVALDGALCRLARLDRGQARVVELRYFGGLLIEEAADVLQVSAAVVRRDWESARLWLYAELRDAASRSPAGAQSCDVH